MNTFARHRKVMSSGFCLHAKLCTSSVQYCQLVTQGSRVPDILKGHRWLQRAAGKHTRGVYKNVDFTELIELMFYILQSHGISEEKTNHMDSSRLLIFFFSSNDVHLTKLSKSKTSD
ncbi:hypothetical protein ILYODFUR_000238 [Ilyodon furcidens]|uniref:Uncharacterized protein n=1 Tax=Ilyodon furcidens TaxID=33524 RepID=A0ABV0UG42_9TELE